jgi:hypothetical protein
MRRRLSSCHVQVFYRTDFDLCRVGKCQQQLFGVGACPVFGRPTYKSGESSLACHLAERHGESVPVVENKGGTDIGRAKQHSRPLSVVRSAITPSSSARPNDRIECSGHAFGGPTTRHKVTPVQAMHFCGGRTPVAVPNPRLCWTDQCRPAFDRFVGAGPDGQADLNGIPSGIKRTRLKVDHHERPRERGNHVGSLSFQHQALALIDRGLM